MGWDETVFTLQEAVNTCTDLDGEIESCPLFTVISEAEQQECKFDMPSALDDDDVDGPMTNLPGNVALAWGPAAANEAATVSEDGQDASTTMTLATLSYSAGSTASVSGDFEAGNIFKVTPTTTTLTGGPAATTGPSDPLITLATSTYTYTGASGDVTISEIVYEEAITWVTEMTTTTVYVEPTTALPTTTTAPAVVRRDAGHAHKFRHARGHKH